MNLMLKSESEMKEELNDFEKDNAFLMAGFEKIDGLIKQNRSKNKILSKQLVGLTYEIEKLNDEIKNLKKSNQILKEENKELKSEVQKEKIIIPQNFNIKNKIIRIVSDIEESDVKSIELKNLVALLIEEIDTCISQLEE